MLTSRFYSAAVGGDKGRKYKRQRVVVADKEQHPGDIAGLKHKSKEESLICEYNKNTKSVSVLFFFNLIPPL